MYWAGNHLVVDAVTRQVTRPYIMCGLIRLLMAENGASKICATVGVSISVSFVGQVYSLDSNPRLGGWWYLVSGKSSEEPSPRSI